MRKIIFILLFSFACTVNAQHLQFPREAINFTIDSVHFIVDGYYYFKNPTNQVLNVPISYPFPNGSSVVDSAWLFNCSQLKAQTFTTGKMDMSFGVSVLPNDSAVYRIGYRERHDGKTAHYILTTTKFWNNPLSDASYSLFVPSYLHVLSFSYQPDKSLNQKNGTLYLFHKKQFMPKEDFIVGFEMQ